MDEAQEMLCKYIRRSHKRGDRPFSTSSAEGAGVPAQTELLLSFVSEVRVCLKKKIHDDKCFDI